MDKQDERKLLNTLKSIDGTLKRIEQILSADKQHEVIKEAVSHAMLGEKYNSTNYMQISNIEMSEKRTLENEVTSNRGTALITERK